MHILYYYDFVVYNAYCEIGFCTIGRHRPASKYRDWYFVVDVYSDAADTWFLSVGDVSTALSPGWSSDRNEGRLRTYVARQSMSSTRRGTSGTQRRSKVHGLFRGRPAVGQCEVFWTVRLRGTYTGSGDGAVKSMLQKYVQIFRGGLPLHYRSDYNHMKQIALSLSKGLCYFSATNFLHRSSGGVHVTDDIDREW